MGQVTHPALFQLAFIGLVPDGVGLSFLDERYAYLSSSQDPSTLADISGSNRPPWVSWRFTTRRDQVFQGITSARTRLPRHRTTLDRRWRSDL